MGVPRKTDLAWFVYIRVSSKDQGDKYGPARQVEAIRNWLAVNVPNVRVPGLDSCVISPREVRASEYVGFDKQTGKNDDRPDFQRGCQMARDGKIGGFISLRLDRVARNAVDAGVLRSKMKRMGVRLEFASQTFDHTPTGDLMYLVYSGFAELEGKLILERTADGRLGRLRDEKLFHSAGAIPFGYTYVDAEIAKAHPGKIIGTAIIHEKHAKIVRLIFRLYVEEEMTGYEIMMYLNRKKIPTKEGCVWVHQSISNVLCKADKYAGGKYVVRLGIEAAKRDYAERVDLMGDNALPIDLSNVIEVELSLPAIITEDMARRANALRVKNKKRAGRPTKYFPLSKLVYCECGALWYWGEKGRAKRKVGWCSHRNYESGGIHMKCHASEMRADKIEGIVIDALKEYCRQPEVAHAAALQAYREEHGSDASQRRAEAEANLEAFREEQKHYGSILLNPALKKLHGQATARFSELEIQIQDLDREMRRAPVSMMYSEASVVAAFGKKLDALEEIETFEEKREFFQSTLNRVDVGKEEIVIAGNIVIPQIASGAGGNSKGRLASAFNNPPSLAFVIRKPRAA